jgi:hypothetical protein
MVDPRDVGKVLAASQQRGREANVHHAGAALEGRGTIRAQGSVRRGVNSARLEAAALILGVPIAVGAATSSALIGLGVFVVLVLVFAVPLTRHLLMEGLHRLTGA